MHRDERTSTAAEPRPSRRRALRAAPPSSSARRPSRGAVALPQPVAHPEPQPALPAQPGATEAPAAQATQTARAPAGPARVLVLDGEQPAALAIVRSLAALGLRCEVGASAPGSLAARSRHCAGSFVYPDPLRAAPEFQRAVLQRLSAQPYALVLPAGESALLPLLGARAELQGLAPLALAASASLELARSRRLIASLAAEIGIAQPRSAVVYRPEDLARARGELAFPLLVRPDRALLLASSGRGRQLPARFAADARELEECIGEPLAAGPVVLQEYVPGESVGLALLAEAGRALFAFQYRELHALPLGGGHGHRVSEAVDPALLAQVNALLARLAWEGPASFHFRRDPSNGQSWLVGVSGLLGAALPLAVAAGADLPAYLCEWQLQGRRSFPAAYRVGLRSRALAAELEWLAQGLARRASPPAAAPTSRLRALGEGARMLDPRERWDGWSWRDPRPGLGELGGAAARLSGGLLRRARGAWLCRRMQRLQARPRALRRRLARARQVVLLCSGNVIRSPLAAARLRQQLGDAHPLRVLSAGIHAELGRAPEPRALRIAAAAGLDTSGHRSQPLTLELARQCDLLIAMDLGQLVALHESLPASLARRALLLGCFERGGPLEIPDPVGRGDAYYEARLAEVSCAADSLAAALQDAAR